MNVRACRPIILVHCLQALNENRVMAAGHTVTVLHTKRWKLACGISSIPSRYFICGFLSPLSLGVAIGLRVGHKGLGLQLLLG